MVYGDAYPYDAYEGFDENSFLVDYHIVSQIAMALMKTEETDVHPDDWIDFFSTDPHTVYDAMMENMAWDYNVTPNVLDTANIDTKALGDAVVTAMGIDYLIGNEIEADYWEVNFDVLYNYAEQFYVAGQLDQAGLQSLLTEIDVENVVKGIILQYYPDQTAEDVDPMLANLDGNAVFAEILASTTMVAERGTFTIG